MRKPAPLFVCCYDFMAWLSRRLEEERRHPWLCEALLQHGRTLLETVTLALHGSEIAACLRDADNAVTLLRVHLTLAEEMGFLNGRQYRFALETLEEIGRQIGGWRKHRDIL